MTSFDIAQLDRRIVVHSPISGEEVGSVPANTSDEVQEALLKVASYRHDMPAKERAHILDRCADLLDERADAFAHQITAESGICVKESAKEVARSIGNLRVAAQEAVRIHGEAIRLSTDRGDKLAISLLEPVGVVAAITPFNRPLNQVVVKLAPAIASNNALIVKPSEKTPLTCLMLEALTHDAGLPEAMFQVVTGDARAIADALIDAQETNLIAFTGSVEIGHAVASRVGMKKLMLELGGNDPMIVLEDADLAAAAKITVEGAIATAGQACRGVKRILVADGIADRFVKHLVELVKLRKPGDPFDPETDVSCMIGAAQAKEAKTRCQDAIEHGARLVLGGQQDGAYLQPTILDNVQADCELVLSETFAPVLPVIRFRDVDEAIDIVNSTKYGLQAGVATENFDTFVQIANQLEVGAVNLMEGPQFDSPHIPFGGVKASGIGREGIRYAIREMTTIKTVVLPWRKTAF